MLLSRRHPEQAFKVCLGLLSLGKKYQAAHLVSACRRANEAGVISYKQIAEFVGQLAEEARQPQLDFTTPLLEHGNIRGSKYYS